MADNIAIHLFDRLRPHGVRQIASPATASSIFPERGVAVAPAKGTALVFFPTLRDGRLNPYALHAGQEVTAGSGGSYNTKGSVLVNGTKSSGAPRSTHSRAYDF